MHDLITSPFLGDYLVVKPGLPAGLAISAARYRQLADATEFPEWLVNAAHRAWDLDLYGQSTAGRLLVRPDTGKPYGKATWELNLGCNYDCEHCYLGLKTFAGLDWEARERLLTTIRDSGVLWLQLTGGEPMVDRLYGPVHARAYELGLMIEILTNGSRLDHPAILELLTTYPASRICVSVYGATPDTYDALTRRPGSYRRFRRGLDAALQAGCVMDLSLIITSRNVHEIDAMRGLAESLGLKWREYSTMSPTIHGGDETLPSQSPQYSTRRKVFTGCDAGHTSYHVDPFGKASICKIGRHPNIDLTAHGIDGLADLGEIADRLLLRQGACTGCTLQSTCGTCMPLVTLYRTARAPLATYCQHGHRKETP